MFTVTFNANEGSPVEAKTVESGGTISLPENPTKDGYVFDGWWFADNTTPFTASTPVTADITVYAKWIESVTVPEELRGTTWTEGSNTLIFTDTTLELTHGGTALFDKLSFTLDDLDAYFRAEVEAGAREFLAEMNLPEETIQEIVVILVEGDETEIIQMFENIMGITNPDEIAGMLAQFKEFRDQIELEIGEYPVQYFVDGEVIEIEGTLLDNDNQPFTVGDKIDDWRLSIKSGDNEIKFYGLDFIKE